MVKKNIIVVVNNWYMEFVPDIAKEGQSWAW
jgi:hypothetical protein